MPQHEKQLLQNLDLLDKHTEADAMANRPSEMRHLIKWFSSDMMGDLIFHGSFGMLESERHRRIIPFLEKCMSSLGPLSPILWFMQIYSSLLPGGGVAKSFSHMMEWTAQQMRDRVEEAGHLLQPFALRAGKANLI